MVFLNKISLDGSFTLTTQPSTLKLSDHPDYFFFLSFFFFCSSLPGKMFPTRGDLHVAPFFDDALYMEHFSKANFWLVFAVYS